MYSTRLDVEQARRDVLMRRRLKSLVILVLTSLLAGCSANRAPVAKIVSPQDGARLSGRTVAFQGEGSDPDGRIAKYQWDFGDAARSDLQNPMHAYAVGGAYTVVLTVVDNRGAAGTASIGIHINLDPVAKVAARGAGFSALPDRICGVAPLDVRFDGSQSGDTDGVIVSYTWDFGDGKGSTGITGSNTYDHPGEYAATLMVTDNDGATAKEVVYIRVRELGAAIQQLEDSLALLPSYESHVFASEADSIHADVVEQIGSLLDSHQLEELSALLDALTQLNALETWTQDMHRILRDAAVRFRLLELVAQRMPEVAAFREARRIVETRASTEILIMLAGDIVWDWCVSYFMGTQR